MYSRRKVVLNETNVEGWSRRSKPLCVDYSQLFEFTLFKSIISMKILHLFFNVFYNLAKSNKYDQTPEHTALITVTLLPVINLITILILIDSQLNFILHEYKYLPFIASIFIFPINYYIFLKNQKYKQFNSKSKWSHLFFILIYVGISFYLFYYSLFALSESVRN